MLTTLLFETPWWLPTTAMGAGLFIWMTGNRRQETKVMRTGLAIALAGVAIMLISYFVETDREKAVKHTRQLVAAVDQHDWAKFELLLSPQTNIYGLHGAKAITEAVKNGAEQYGLTSARITGLESEPGTTEINVSIRVLSDQLGRAGFSDWRLRYENFGQGWVLSNVQAISNEQIKEETIKNRISRP